LALAGLALFVVPGALARAADGGADKPMVLVRIEPLEELAADARALAKAAGREELVRQVQAILKAHTGPKGVEGIDPKKPIGLYGSLDKQLNRSQAVLLLPVSDEKTFLDFLGSFGLEPKKDADGLYTLKVEKVPFPVQFRFANGYLYAMPRFSATSALPAKDKLPLPAAVLAGGEGMLSVTANLDRVPPAIRNVAVSSLAVELGHLKKAKAENEGPAHHELHGAVLDALAVQGRAVLEDGGAVMLKIAHDRKKNDLSLAASFAAKKGSALAKTLAGLATQTSLAGALLGQGEAMGGFLHVRLPEGVRKALGPVVDEAVKQGLAHHDEGARALLAPVAEALKPTMKEGVFDVGLSLRGPNKGGKYTVVGCYRLQAGEGVEKAVKKLVGQLPEEARKPFTFDVDKAGGVAIHRVEQEKLKAAAADMLGGGPLYFAVRKDAVLFTLGEGALATLKEGLAAEPKAGKLLQVDLSLGRIAGLMKAQDKSAPEIAKKVFTEAGSDRVRLSLAAGRRLELKLSVKTQALAFAAALDKARKEKAGE
jgi:hypothetical protein